MSDAGPLIVPVALEALVVNDHVRDPSFLRAPMAYGSLQMGGDAQPGMSGNEVAFGRDEPVEGVPAAHYYDGVYLKWRLPRALTWGVQDSATGKLTFPPVPNRWIVVRYGGGTRAWLVESDYVWTSALTPKDVSGLPSHFLVEKEGKPQLAFIGRSYDLGKESWQETGHSLGLTALGPGNPAFAFYQPHNNNVFSFVDVLGEAADATYSYQVFGWYAVPGEDPLAAAVEKGFAKVLDELGWTVPEKTDPGLSASRTVFAGYLDGVRWQTEAAPRGGAPKEAGLSIATANSSVEALTALVAAQAAAAGVEVEPELLEAFQLDALAVLDEPDGEEKLAELLHDSLFQRFGGGYRWEIVGAPGSEEPSPGELRRERAWLLQLNQAQAALDGELRELGALRLRLYELWWKWFNWRPGQETEVVEGRHGKPLTKAELLEALQPQTRGSVAAEVEKKLQEVEASALLVPGGGNQQELAEAIAKYAEKQGLPLTRLLKRTEAPSYYEPNNPVVLISGAGASGIIPAPETTLCRFPSQLVRGLEWKGRPVTAATAGLKVPLPDLDGASGMPWPASLAAELAGEAFFTDPGNAAAISAAVPGSTAGEIETAMGAAALGTRPAGALASWSENPWHPLLLIWKAEYFPIPYGSGKDPNWVFEEGRYVWNGRGEVEEPVTFGGTIQLGTAAVFNMAARIEKFLASQPKLDPTQLAALKKLLTFIDTQHNDWDLLSQALDGFNQQLLLGMPGVYANPSRSEAASQSPLGKLVGNAPGYPPGIGPLPEEKLPPDRFKPLRGGQFRFTELALVDEWGQALYPITPLGTEDTNVFMPASMSPVVGSNPFPFTVSAAGAADSEWDLAAPATSAVGGAVVAITAISPTGATAGSKALPLTVEGGGFDQHATVTWNGLPLETRYVGAAKLEATVPQELLEEPEVATVGISVPRLVKAEETASFVQLGPAIPQPARLVFDLVSAAGDQVVVGPLAPEANPVCGWVLPNHLDRSLMAYEASGAPLGELSLAVGPASTKARPCWWPAPESPYETLEEVEAHVPHLGAMLAALQAQEAAVFTAFLTAIDETLWTTAPAAEAYAHDLAALIGCPLALVRARAGFDLQGGPRRDRSWGATFGAQPAGLAEIPLAIGLGRRARLDDGLVGYFEANEYKRFNTVAEIAGGEYLRTIGADGNYVFLPPTAGPIALSLLLDPRAPVHATTGVLPAGNLAVPPRLVESALAALQVSFRLNGVLTETKTTVPPGGGPAEAAIQLPLPSVGTGEWSWIEKDRSKWKVYPAEAADTTAALGDVLPVLRRGLLRLGPFTKPKSNKEER